MRTQVLPDDEAVARRAAELIVAEARGAIDARGRFLFAASGGATPWQMFRILSDREVPWVGVHLFQVDERVAPPGHPDRNLTHLAASLLDRVLIPAGHVHLMPVEDTDLDAAAARYSAELKVVGGTPAVLDLVHLGLGADGHTASLVPGDAVLGVADADVAITGEYRGYRRMTITLPVLDRARLLLWVVTGADKAEALARLLGSDRSIPAGRVRA